MLRNTVISIHLLLLIFNLYNFSTNSLTPKEYILGYCIFIIFSIFHFSRVANFIVLAYTFGFTSVLFTAFLLQELSERIKFNGWMQENLLAPSLMSRSNAVIMIGISTFCLSAIFANRGNKKLFTKPPKPLSFAETKAKNWVAFISIILGVTYSWLNGAPSLGEVAYAQGSVAIREFGKENSSFSYIIGIVFTGVASYLAYHNSSFKKKFVRIIFGFTIFTALYYNLYAGDRDGTLTFVILFLGMFWVYNKMSEAKKTMIVVCTGVAMYFVLIIIGGARGMVVEKGIVGAVSTTQIIKEGESFSPTENLDLLPIMYWQTLAAVDLYDHGNSFNMKSFINLVPQFIPSPVANFFGYTRPINVAWELRRYHNHGGGFFVIGEAYWNGGIVAVIVVFALLAIFLVWLERWFYTQERYLLAFYFGLISSFPYSVFYTFQGMARWVEVWVGFALLFKIWLATVKVYEMKKRKRLECAAS